MGRILSIDYGKKRTGLAVTDPEKIIATPLSFVQTRDLLTYLTSYCEKEQVEAFVIGYPEDLEGRASNISSEVIVFSKKLAKKFPAINIHFHDENFTSRLALQSMIDAGFKKSQRRDKGTIDRISATIILQSFLENNKL